MRGAHSSKTSDQRLCHTRAPAASANGLARLSLEDREAGVFCDVRDTVAYGVSSAAFPTFLRARKRALATIEAAYRAHDFGRLAVANGSFGLPTDGFGAPIGLPWVDIWLPAALDSIHVLPSIAVQHIKQADALSSQKFEASCAFTAHPTGIAAFGGATGPSGST